MSLSVAGAVGTRGSPVKTGLARGAFSAKALVMVVAKFGSLPSAVASSLSVSRAAGDEATSCAIAVITKAVLADCRVLVPAGAVGTNGVPLKSGLASDALSARAWSICVLVYTSVRP
ncbi:hypothetical protein D3C76_1201770 [compost metagenome]